MKRKKKKFVPAPPVVILEHEDIRAVKTSMLYDKGYRSEREVPILIIEHRQLDSLGKPQWIRTERLYLDSSAWYIRVINALLLELRK